MKINRINSVPNIRKNLSERTTNFSSKDSLNISFKKNSEEKPSFLDKLMTKIEKKRKEQYEKSLPCNMTDRKLKNAVRLHGKKYLDSLKTREEREKFLSLMHRDFEGKPMSGASKTLSAYEANEIITKGITDIQTYINLVGHDENYKPISGLSRILGRHETGEIMQAGVTDYQRYIDLVDEEKDGTSKAGYSRVLTLEEAIIVLTEDIDDVEAFIAEQDKNK